MFFLLCFFLAVTKVRQKANNQGKDGQCPRICDNLHDKHEA